MEKPADEKDAVISSLQLQLEKAKVTALKYRDALQTLKENQVSTINAAERWKIELTQSREEVSKLQTKLKQEQDARAAEQTTLQKSIEGNQRTTRGRTKAAISLQTDQKEAESLKNELQHERALREGLQDQVNTLTNELASLRKRHEEQQLKQHSSEEMTILQQTVHDLQQQLETSKQHASSLQQTMESQRQQSQDAINKEQSALEALQRQFQEVSNEAQSAKAALAKLQHDTQQQQVIHDQAAEDLRKQLQETKASAQAQEEQIHQLQRQLQQEREQHSSSMAKETDMSKSLRQELDDAAARLHELQQAQETSQHAVSQLGDCKAQLESCQEDLLQCRGQLKLATQEAEAHRHDAELMQQEVHRLEAEMQRQQVSAAGAVQELDSTKKQVEQLQASLTQAQEAAAQQGGQLQSLTQDHSHLNTKYRKLHTRYSQLVNEQAQRDEQHQQQRREQEEKVQQLQAQVQQLTDALSEAQQKLQQQSGPSQHEMAAVRGQMSQMALQVAELLGYFDDLRRQRLAMQLLHGDAHMQGLSDLSGFPDLHTPTLPRPHISGSAPGSGMYDIMFHAPMARMSNALQGMHRSLFPTGHASSHNRDVPGHADQGMNLVPYQQQLHMARPQAAQHAQQNANDSVSGDDMAVCRPGTAGTHTVGLQHANSRPRAAGTPPVQQQQQQQQQQTTPNTLQPGSRAPEDGRPGPGNQQQRQTSQSQQQQAHKQAKPSDQVAIHVVVGEAHVGTGFMSIPEKQATTTAKEQHLKGLGNHVVPAEKLSQLQQSLQKRRLQPHDRTPDHSDLSVSTSGSGRSMHPLMLTDTRGERGALAMALPSAGMDTDSGWQFDEVDDQTQGVETGSGNLSPSVDMQAHALPCLPEPAVPEQAQHAQRADAPTLSHRESQQHYASGSANKRGVTDAPGRSPSPSPSPSPPLPLSVTHPHLNKVEGSDEGHASDHVHKRPEALQHHQSTTLHVETNQHQDNGVSSVQPTLTKPPISATNPFAEQAAQLVQLEHGSPQQQQQQAQQQLDAGAAQKQSAPAAKGGVKRAAPDAGSNAPPPMSPQLIRPVMSSTALSSAAGQQPEHHVQDPLPSAKRQRMEVPPQEASQQAATLQPQTQSQPLVQEQAPAQQTSGTPGVVEEPSQAWSSQQPDARDEDVVMTLPDDPQHEHGQTPVTQQQQQDMTVESTSPRAGRQAGKAGSKQAKGSDATPAKSNSTITTGQASKGGRSGRQRKPKAAEELIETVVSFSADNHTTGFARSAATGIRRAVKAIVAALPAGQCALPELITCISTAVTGCSATHLQATPDTESGACLRQLNVATGKCGTGKKSPLPDMGWGGWCKPDAWQSCTVPLLAYVVATADHELRQADVSSVGGDTQVCDLLSSFLDAMAAHTLKPEEDSNTSNTSVAERCAATAGFMWAAMLSNNRKAARGLLVDLLELHCPTPCSMQTAANSKSLNLLLPLVYTAVSVWPQLLQASLTKQQQGSSVQEDAAGGQVLDEIIDPLGSALHALLLHVGCASTCSDGKTTPSTDTSASTQALTQQLAQKLQEAVWNLPGSHKEVSETDVESWLKLPVLPLAQLMQRKRACKAWLAGLINTMAATEKALQMHHEVMTAEVQDEDDHQAADVMLNECMDSLKVAASQLPFNILLHRVVQRLLSLQAGLCESTQVLCIELAACVCERQLVISRSSVPGVRVPLDPNCTSSCLSCCELLGRVLQASLPNNNSSQTALIPADYAQHAVVVLLCCLGALLIPKASQDTRNEQMQRVRLQPVLDILRTWAKRPPGPLSKLPSDVQHLLRQAVTAGGS